MRYRDISEIRQNFAEMFRNMAARMHLEGAARFGSGPDLDRRDGAFLVAERADDGRRERRDVDGELELQNQ